MHSGIGDAIQLKDLPGDIFRFIITQSNLTFKLYFAHHPSRIFGFPTTLAKQRINRKSYQY